jgi:hypothetical protein
MGQAFDRDGNVLGEAFGDTKREVFDKLTAEFAQAHEIRIRTLEDRLRDERSGGASSPVSAEHPLMRAWTAYKASEAYANTKKWLAQGSPSGGDGELWAAFETGWRAGLSSLEAPSEASR